MQQQGGSPYGVPPPATASFPPQLSDSPRQPPVTSSRNNFEDLVSAAAGSLDDDTLAADGGSGSGNRWPRQETLALLKIRSDMDTAFKESPIKGPLWEDVSRKLGELGYIRSSKKCKEKFENVHKYYKRTKDTKSSRPDGKSYRFFSQLEALHSVVAASVTMAQPITTASPAPSPTTPIGTNASVPSLARVFQQPPISVPPVITFAPPVMSTFTTPVALGGVSFSSDTFTTSESDSDGVSVKRKREGAINGSIGPGPTVGSPKMMEFFEGLMKKVMDKQEAMQKRFMEAIEKREQDRVVREEAWKRQEMARLSREHEILAQERAMAAARDAAVIAFLQKISGNPLQASPIAAAIPSPATAPAAAPMPPAPAHPQPPPQQIPPANDNLQPQIQQSSSSTEIVSVPDGIGTYEGAPSSSRWPKTEIHALINIRSGLDERYQEAGPKGPLWEEISAGMGRLGYNRSSKRCKEKWENINKYFKKVRESNKKRPEDAKTCPYYHALDIIYRKKYGNGGGGGGSSGVTALPASTTMPAIHQSPMSIAPPQVLQPQAPRQPVSGINNGSNGDGRVQIQASNGGLPRTIGNSTVMKKPEELMKEMMEQQQQQRQQDDYNKMEDQESDSMDDEDDDEDEEDMKMQYEIQYQKPNVSNGGDASSAKPTPAAATAGSFLAMVQ